MVQTFFITYLKRRDVCWNSPDIFALHEICSLRLPANVRRLRLVWAAILPIKVFRDLRGATEYGDEWDKKRLYLVRFPSAWLILSMRSETPSSNSSAILSRGSGNHSCWCSRDHTFVMWPLAGEFVRLADDCGNISVQLRAVFFASFKILTPIGKLTILKARCREKEQEPRRSQSILKTMFLQMCRRDRCSKKVINLVILRALNALIYLKCHCA